MRLSVIIVTFNSAGLVEGAIRSATDAARVADAELELIVVDNASADGTAEAIAAAHPEVNLIRNADNEGFGRANNRAFREATGDYWLLLNPDASLDPDALVHLLAFLDARPRVAAVAPTVEDARGGGAESGGMAPGARSLASHFLMLNRLLAGDRGGPWRGFQLARRSSAAPRPADWLGAMALLVRPSAIREVGGFDERFFLYGEDVDLGERLTRAGWELWLLPAARARHLIAGSQGGVSTRWVQALHDAYAHHSGRGRTVGLDVILAAGLSFRAAIATATGANPLHRRRMRAAAQRAIAILWNSMVGRR